MDRIIQPKVRIIRQTENHFLKKLSSKIVNTALKVGEKSAINSVVRKSDGEITKEQAKAAIDQARATPEAKQIVRKVTNAGTATLATAAILGAGALAAPALGIGGASAGAGAAGTGAATGGGVSAGTVATGTGAVGAVGAAIPKQDKPPSAAVFDENNNPNVPPKNQSLRDLGNELKDQLLTPEVAKQIGAKIATGIKNRKEKLGTTRRLDDMVSGNEIGSGNNNDEKGGELLAMFGDTNPMIIVGLVILVLLMLMKKRK